MIPAELAQELALAPAHEFWIGWLLAAGGSAAGLFGLFRFVGRARLMEDTPTSLVRSAAQGYVELEGDAALMEGDPIVAPLTATPCVWYRYKVEKRVRSGRRAHWRTLRDGTSDELFLLRDVSGDCVIDPEGAEVTPSVRQVWYGSSEHPVQPSGGGGWGGLIGGGRYRYTEARIHAADSLYALGWFRSVGGAQDSFNTGAEVRELLALWKRDQRELVQRFDRDGDGAIDMQEWSTAREAAAAEVAAAQRERALQPAVHTLSKPPHGQTYLLSTQPQLRMAGRFRWYAAACLVAFLALGGGAVWALGVRLAGA